MVRPLMIHFVNAEIANHLVAGIPAAARAVHQVARIARPDSEPVSYDIAVPGGWVPSKWCRAEIKRLAPGVTIRAVDSRDPTPRPGMIHISGEMLIIDPEIVGADLTRAMSSVIAPSQDPVPVAPSSADVRELRAAFQRAGNEIVRNTGKPGDGIVSRTINRPISRSITRVLLRIQGITPYHATAMATLLGIVMAAFLFAGGATGLVVGGLLFQAASIMDGVDGEIARATFRSSRAGATLDSTVDALTNLTFIAGLSFNLFHEGDMLGSAAGASGLAIMALGLFLIGRRARQSGGALNFDGVKDHFRQRKSRLMQWLAWLTMRDFYAAAAALFVVLGLATEMLVVFVTVAAGWLGVTVSVLFRSSRPYAIKPEA